MVETAPQISGRADPNRNSNAIPFNNINDPESAPIRIGDNAVVKINANIGNAAIS